jgi:hypothetical protein
VWLHFRELKTKPCKGFKSTKWRSHFVLWYYDGALAERNAPYQNNKKAATQSAAAFFIFVMRR